MIPRLAFAARVVAAVSARPPAAAGVAVDVDLRDVALVVCTVVKHVSDDFVVDRVLDVLRIRLELVVIPVFQKLVVFVQHLLEIFAQNLHGVLRDAVILDIVQIVLDVLQCVIVAVAWFVVGLGYGVEFLQVDCPVADTTKSVFSCVSHQTLRSGLFVHVRDPLCFIVHQNIALGLLSSRPQSSAPPGTDPGPFN